ncbi:hypothetical protein LR013_05660 [candidate division NPL-UPA2 bacterium]|nr:hypothetical protein [candidate division NPL-UPA2 bacterium]
MKRLLKIIAIGWIVGLVIWSIYLTHLAIEVIPGWFEEPVNIVWPVRHVWEKEEEPQFKVGIKLPSTQFRVGERISVRPYIINIGEQPITIDSSHPLFFFTVFDEEHEPVGPRRWGGVGMMIHTLKPQEPLYAHPKLYTFILEEPGRYKISARACFGFNRLVEGVRTYTGVLVLSEPIWIEVSF